MIGLIVAVALVFGIGTPAVVYFAVVRGGAHHGNARTSPSPSPSGMQMPVTANSQLLADGGHVVFSDDFHDPNSGWAAGSAASGTTFQYSNGAFVVVGKGSLHHLLLAPYDRALLQISVETTATQTSGAPTGAGFGVMCETGSGSSTLDYQLIVLQPGTWYLERSEGQVSPTNAASVIKRGSAPDPPGASPLRIVGVCATLADGKTTRLALFVNGNQVADATDQSSSAVSGWVAGIVTSSRDTQASTVTFTEFRERDLSGQA